MRHVSCTRGREYRYFVLFFCYNYKFVFVKNKKGVREGVGLVWRARARKEEETMGEVSESTTTKRKKKGRPSLLDLQKRSLKKEQQNHHQQRQSNNSNSANSHNNKNKTNKNAVPHDDDEDERKEKKHKLLVGLNSHLQNPTLFPNSQPFNSDPNKRRKTIDPLQTVRFIVTIFNYNPP